MAIKVRVQNNLQIIVPVRIGRAIANAAPALDAPDPDDRGWVNNRAAGLNVNSTVRGALFGIVVGDVVRLKVLREDIDAAVPLFVTATGGQVEIDPGSTGQLTGDGVFKVHALQDSTSPTTIQVHLGSATGAVICEADAHVFSPLTLNITPHVCTIHSAATAGAGTGQKPSVNGFAVDAAQITNIFKFVSAIWRPAGVLLNVGAVRDEVLAGFLLDDFASQNRPGVGSEENVVMGTNQVANTCNIYFLRFMDRSLGVGVRFETRAGEGMTHSGILIGVEGSSNAATGTGITRRSSAGTDLVHEIANDVAHEIGHFLTLPHASNVNSPGLPDTYGRRQLMHPNNLLPMAVTPLTATSIPRFNDIGYGVVGGLGHRGCLLTLKDHPKNTSDGEVISARARFRSPNLFK